MFFVFCLAQSTARNDEGRHLKSETRAVRYSLSPDITRRSNRGVVSDIAELLAFIKHSP